MMTVNGLFWITKWNIHVDLREIGVHRLTDNWVILFMHIQRSSDIATGIHYNRQYKNNPSSCTDRYSITSKTYWRCERLIDLHIYTSIYTDKYGIAAYNDEYAVTTYRHCGELMELHAYWLIRLNDIQT